MGDLRKARYHAFATDANNNVIGSSGEPLTFDPVIGYTENVQYNALNVTSQANKPYDANLKYYDHFDLLFREAYTVNNSVAVSGGRDKFDFSFSASNNTQESNIINNGGVSRSNISANIGVELFKGLRFRTTTQLAYTKNTLRSLDRNIVYSIFNSRPFADYNYKDPDGNYVAYYGDAVGVNGLNPNFYQQYSDTKDNKVDIIQSFNLNYKFTKFLELDAKYGLNYQNQQQEYEFKDQRQNKNAFETNSYVSYFAPDVYTGGEISNWNYNKLFQNFLATATFSTDFQNDFNINLPIRPSIGVEAIIASSLCMP